MLMITRARYAWNEGDLKIPNTYGGLTVKMGNHNGLPLQNR
jgi:hypothetical protein